MSYSLTEKEVKRINEDFSQCLKFKEKPNLT